jgi:hypothetical protein
LVFFIYEIAKEENNGYVIIKYVNNNHLGNVKKSASIFVRATALVGPLVPTTPVDLLAPGFK